ncbi:unnamed protein product, partial [Strongylus vulgaris]
MVIPVLLSGIVVALAQQNYDDKFARNITFPLSAAAYADDPQRCVERVFPGGEMVKHITVNCGWWSKCSGFVANISSENAIALSFRGTKGKLQLVDIFGKTLSTKRIRWSVNNQYLGQVGRYFHDAFHAIWKEGMEKHVQELLQNCPKCKIWVTGHSLGGSMASIAASYLAWSGLANDHEIRLVTFGQPKTGDTNFGSTLTDK